MDTDWPFLDPMNVAVITVRQITQREHPILRVYHDIDDGSWHFLEGGAPDENEATVVSLSRIVLLDPTVKQLADLPPGWGAWREGLWDEWKRVPVLSDGG